MYDSKSMATEFGIPMLARSIIGNIPDNNDPRNGHLDLVCASMCHSSLAIESVHLP